MKANNSVVILIMQIFHSHFHYSFAKLEKVNMHPRQFPLLRLLSEYPGLNQREIAEKLHIKPPTVAVSVKRLEKAGYIERKQDENNQRISRIYITDIGMQVVKLGRKLILEEEQTLLEGFSPEEISLLRDYLQRINKNLTHKKD
jgi:DNA-binding MarR family transcriptional regulator